MSISWSLAFLCVGVCCLSLIAYGQGNEVSLSLGAAANSFTSGNPPGCITAGFPGCGTFSGAFSLDSGFAFRAAFAHHLIGAGAPASLDLELPFLAVPSRGTNIPGALSPGDLSSYFFTPSFKFRIVPKAPISPFLSFGGGLAHYNTNSTSTNKAAADLGAGADFRTPLPLLRLRMEVRDLFSGQPNFSPGTASGDNTLRHNFFFGGGIVLRF